MYPPGPFADSVGSFRQPVDPPTAGPFDSPLFEVCINRDWLPFIAGALKQLLLQSTWTELSDSDLEALQGKVFDLISAFGQVNPGCGIIPPNILCISGDWKDEKYGTEADPSVTCSPTYDAVVGWTGCDDGSSHMPKLGLIQTFDQSTFVHSYRATGTIPALWTGHLYFTAYFNGSVVAAVDNAIIGGPTVDFTWNCDVQADQMVLLLVSDNATPFQTITLQSFEICYIGDFPLAGHTDRFTHVWDFSLSDGGWTASRGNYASGGWNADSQFANPYYYMTVNIYHNAAGVRLFSIVVEYAYTQGTHTINTGDTDGLYEWSPYVALQTNDYRSVPPSPYEWHGDRTFAHNILVQIIPGIKTTNPADGSCKITKITVTGAGSDPF